MKKRLTSKRRSKQRQRNIWIMMGISAVLAIAVLGVFCIMVGRIFDGKVLQARLNSVFNRAPVVLERLPNIDANELFLTPNPYSRPQTMLKEVKGIVIHYVANPGTDAEANRNYFENLAVTQSTRASSHYIIGLDGQIVQCVPLNEVAYASNERNEDTISIENCHPDKSGEFTEETYNALVRLAANLCDAYDLDTNQLLRHHDVNGKKCPLYYVENEDDWNAFKQDVKEYMKKL